MLFAVDMVELRSPLLLLLAVLALLLLRLMARNWVGICVGDGILIVAVVVVIAVVDSVGVVCAVAGGAFVG